MSVVFSDIGSALGQKNLLGEETEEVVKAAEECAAAVFEKESATSKVPYEGIPRFYPCLCYPKELLKKEDEIRNGPHYVHVPPDASEVALRKTFTEWSKKYGRDYKNLDECRLRYKIWLNFKERMEQLYSKSGRTFSMEKMNMDADRTQIEFKLGNRGRVIPSEHPLSVVKKGILDRMGESWMEKTAVEFDKWAERHKRAYSSIEEREKRLLAYLDNMKVIVSWEARYPGEWGFGSDLENMDQFSWEKDLVPPAECSRCRPCKVAPVRSRFYNRDSQYC